MKEMVTLSQTELKRMLVLQRVLEGQISTFEAALVLMPWKTSMSGMGVSLPEGKNVYNANSSVSQVILTMPWGESIIGIKFLVFWEPTESIYRRE
ncbi:hypothetical protein [Desulfofundulus salinus]|uniref:Uncharacterized protein n=1 Tax=Desulfofundulus salinus TaxID=2419843 RepID=A0A494WYX6_9FIRM|nr:hypothetical protein [Desulfofundulus salinum]RKO65830.1 hypothetical protein D7024_01860 [Desulfofundulus salinum]